MKRGAVCRPCHSPAHKCVAGGQYIFLPARLHTSHSPEKYHTRRAAERGRPFKCSATSVSLALVPATMLTANFGLLDFAAVRPMKFAPMAFHRHFRPRVASHDIEGV